MALRPVQPSLLTCCNSCGAHNKHMASLTVSNKAGDVVADGVTAQTFMAFKRARGKGTAVVIELDCGEEILVDTVALFRKLPSGAEYKARLLRRTIKLPEALGENAAGCHVWDET